MECGRAATRMRVGEALLAEAREYSPSRGIKWSELDGPIAAAAEAAARGAKLEVLRARKRVAAQRWVTGGVFAAAAAGVFGWRARVSSQQQQQAAAALAASNAAQSAPAGVVPEAARAVEATVLLVASPSTYEQGEAPARALTLASSLRAGVRLRTGERGGRTVVALGEGARVDVRAGSDVTIDRWSSREAVLGLAKGEARVENSSGTEVSVRSAGWSLRSPGGAFLAKLEGGSLRVSVLQGKVTVRSADGSVSREARAGSVLELAENGAGLREVSHEASDAAALPEGLLATRGGALELAALAGAAVGQLEIEGARIQVAGALAMRAAHAVTVRASVGDARFFAALDPSHGAGETRAVVWQSVVAVAVANGSGNAPVQRGPRLASARPAASSEAPVAPTPAVVVASDEEVTAATQRIEAALPARVRYCFHACDTTGDCAPRGPVTVTVRVNALGQVEDSQENGTQNACLHNEVLATRWPAGTSRTLTLTVRR